MDWKKLVISPETTILQALQLIDTQGSRFIIVADENLRLVGVVTDGNIRRGLLHGFTLQDSVSLVMNATPCTVLPSVPRSAAFVLMETQDFSHLPIINDQGILVGLWVRKELQHASFPNPVVLMAGGLGTRLGELTRDCPKPMLRVGGKPLLEILLRSFVEDGFRNFFISVNHMAEKIEQYFGDGHRFGANISYIKESKRLGTAGALSLLPERPSHPLIIMNGDILTRLHGSTLLEEHETHKAIATMVVRQYEMHVPYGVVDFDQTKTISSLREKPAITFPISAGINVLSPEALSYIPTDQFFDMPDLYRTLLEHGHHPRVYETNEYWIDIGRQGDYTQANEDFDQYFSQSDA